MPKLISKLPPAPTLDESHLRELQFVSEKHGRLEALIPVAAPYVCSNPDAPALLLIPGLGMDGLGFLRQLPLGALAHLHLFQTPNHTPANEAGIDAFAHHVENYIIESKLDKHPGGVILGGCSMGGAVSLATAIRSRIKLRGLVLIGTFGASRHLPFWQRWGSPLAWAAPHGLLRRVAYHAVGKTRIFGQVKQSEAHWLVSSKIQRTQSYYGHAVGALTHMDQIAKARQLNVPALVLHGTHDYVLPYAAGVELAQVVPNARLVTLQDAGHALFFTHHEEVNSAIAEFIRA